MGITHDIISLLNKENPELLFKLIGGQYVSKTGLSGLRYLDIIIGSAIFYYIFYYILY
jgi:hypothetical protein